MSTNTKVTIEKKTVPSGDTAVVSTHHSMTQSPPSEVPIFYRGGGYSVFMRSSNLGEGMGILCELRSEVPKCTMIISNGGILV